MLAPEGFQVAVTDDYDALGDEAVGDFDLVVPVITDGRLERDKMARLVAAIRAGTGLAGYHMGLATSFRDSVPFRYAASCYWVAHPGGIIPYRVEITAPIIPSWRGWKVSSTSPSSTTSTTIPPSKCWRPPGSPASTTAGGRMSRCRWCSPPPTAVGRVFYSSLGHPADELEREPVRTITKRGLLWAARDRGARACADVNWQ